MQKKCTKYFFSPFVDKNEGGTISYKDEEVISIPLASKKDANKQFKISKDVGSIGSRIPMNQTVKISDFLSLICA